MPGPHVDKIYQAAQDKLYYKPLTDGEVLLASDQRIAEDTRLKATNQAIGTEVFRDIENSGLTPQEKQEVHQKLAQYGMQQELQAKGVSTNPNTLLRENSRYSNYTTAYLEQYGKGYMESVRDSTYESSLQTPIPPSTVGKVGTCFKVVETAYAATNATEVRDSIKKQLEKEGVPKNVVDEVTKVFESNSVGNLRSLSDPNLKDDVRDVLLQNGVKPEGFNIVDKAFKDERTKLAKLTNLAGGKIPPEDMPPSGQLLDYMKQHGLAGGIMDDEKAALEGVLVQDFQTLHKMQVDVGHKMLDATGKNLAQLSPEAQGFLKSAFQPVTDPVALNMAGASTLVLRLNSPKISTDGQSMGSDPTFNDHGALLSCGARTVQRYVNSINEPSAKHDYANLGCSDLQKDQTLKKQTLDSIQAVGKGQDLDNFSRTAGGPLTVDAGARAQMTKMQRAAELGALKKSATMAGLNTEFQQISATQTKLDKLNKPGINTEKFKAFFSRGGISGAKQKAQQALGDLQKDFNDKVAQKEKDTAQKKQVQGLKDAAQRKLQVQNAMPGLPQAPSQGKKSLSLSDGEAQNLLNALNKLGDQSKNKIPQDLLLTPEEVDNLQKGLKNLKKATNKKKQDSLSLGEDEASDLLKTLKETTESPKPGKLKVTDDQADDLMKKLNNLKDPSGEVTVGTVKLTKDQTADLLGQLDNAKSQTQELDLGSLKLTGSDLDDVLKSLKNMEQDDLSEEVDDLSQEEGVEGFDLSDSDFSNLLEGLKSVSPEVWDQVEEQMVDTDLSPEEIGDLIKELEEMDLEGPKEEMDLEGVDVSPDEIQNMIDELDAFDPSQSQTQTRGRSKSVGSILEGSKQGTEQKPKVGSNSLRSKHPELLHKDGEKPQGQTHGHGV